MIRIDLIYKQFAEKIYNKYNIKIKIEYTEYVNKILNLVNVSKFYFIDHLGTVYKINKTNIQFNKVYKASIINLNDI